MHRDEYKGFILEAEDASDSDCIKAMWFVVDTTGKRKTEILDYDYRTSEVNVEECFRRYVDQLLA